MECVLALIIYRFIYVLKRRYEAKVQKFKITRSLGASTNRISKILKGAPFPGCQRKKEEKIS